MRPAEKGSLTFGSRPQPVLREHLLQGPESPLARRLLVGDDPVRTRAISTIRAPIDSAPCAWQVGLHAVPHAGAGGLSMLRSELLTVLLTVIRRVMAVANGVGD